MKKTKWYPGHFKPVRVGLYERKYDGLSEAFDYWDGERWRYSIAGMGAMKQDRQWRGLTAPDK